MKNKNYKMTQSVILAEAGIQKRGSRIKCGMTTIVLATFFAGICSVQAISISPQMIEFRSSPGEIKEFKIKLKNDEKNQICFKMDVAAISKMNTDGSPVFDTEAATEAIVPWFSIKEKNICAPASETINPTLVIQIPNNIKPGGYYAAAYFSAWSDKLTESGSAVINRIGVLTAMRIDGDVLVEQAKINQFAFDAANKKFLIDFTNEGTVHLRPYGEILIKTKSGQEIDKLPFNEAGVLVLPDSQRHFEIFWDKRLYEDAEATLQILYGTGPKMAAASIALKGQAPKNELNSRVWLIILLAVGAVALGYIIKKIRRNNY